MELPEIRNPFTNGKIVGARIDANAYHKQPEGINRGHKSFVMSRSELMLFESNPRRWRDGYTFKETDATFWGDLMDCLYTCSERFKERYIVEPETCTATKSMKIVQEGLAQAGDQVPWRPCAETKEWKVYQEAKGLTVVSRGEKEQADEAMDRLRKDPIIESLYVSCRLQMMVVAEYNDRETKLVIPVKTLIDLAPLDECEWSHSLGDFKTARNANPDDWDGEVTKRCYDVQAWMSLNIFNCATSQGRSTWYHVIQENLFPWQPARRLVNSQHITIGGIRATAALRRYCKCLATDTWPSWDDEPLEDRNNYQGWSECKPKPWALAKYIGQI